MCVMSAVMDYGYGDWTRRFVPFRSADIGYPPQPPVTTPSPTKPSADEIAAFEELIRKAKAYDDMTGQPDCEIPAKKRLLTELADKLGVKIELPG